MSTITEHDAHAIWRTYQDEHPHAHDTIRKLLGPKRPSRHRRREVAVADVAAALATSEAEAVMLCTVIDAAHLPSLGMATYDPDRRVLSSRYHPKSVAVEDPQHPWQLARRGANTPQLSDEERRDRAHAWARAYAPAQTVTDDLVTQLTPFVHAPLTGGEQRAIRHLLTTSQPITPDTIRARIADRHAQMERWADSRSVTAPSDWAYAQELSVQHPDAARACEFIDTYRAEHGTGPSWSLIGEHMGWRWGRRGVAITKLRKLGLITFTQEPGSIQTVPRDTAPTSD